MPFWEFYHALLFSPTANLSSSLKGNGAGIHVSADFVLLPNFKDQWFLTTDNGIINFLEAKRISSLLYTLIGIQYETWTEQFSASVDGEQLSSTDLHIYKIDENGPILFLSVFLSPSKGLER